MLDNISELIDYILISKKIKNHNEKHVLDNVIEEIFMPLMEKHSEAFYPILRDRILYAINAYKIPLWRDRIGYSNVFPLTMDKHHHAYSLHEWFGEVLKKKVRNNDAVIIKDIRNFLNQNEANCYEYAFMAMIERPLSFSEDIIAILNDYKLIDELLSFSDVTYYFLELIKKWLPLVDCNTLSMCQKLIYEYKSDSDLLPQKDRSLNNLCYPQMGYKQRKLIWAIPENLQNSQIKRRRQELNRRFGVEWKNEKPDHEITAAYSCGGLMSVAQYKTVSCEGWRKSFNGIKNYAGGKFRHFDERAHADAFKQCVSERPYYFEKFVFHILLYRLKYIFSPSGLNS